ncbi:MAG: HepT-like ribonuclease domain-containing protein [Thermodesulfobacteriota bacterium]
MKPDIKAERLVAFLEETIVYFINKTEKIDMDRYFADRDSRNILDKTLNDAILCIVDIAEECLKKKSLAIPDTYKDTVLACYELLGEVALKIAPLTKHRNETIHQYLKVNWQNIVTVKKKIPDIREFAAKAKDFFTGK